MAESGIRNVNHTASGASIRVHPFGATILSWETKDRSVLFVSKLALLDGSKPVRGGIPVVFPIFGPPASGSMPQHGFGRRNLWELVDSYDTSESAGFSFQLDYENVKDGIGEDNPWSLPATKNCKLILKVDFDDKHMNTTLTIANTGTSAFDFQTLLHTYYNVTGKAALQADQCFVEGLKGYTVIDKVTRDPPRISDEAIISIVGEVDRVYEPPAEEPVVNVTIGVGGNQKLTMEAKGTVDKNIVPVACVVWNPYVETAKGMSDFGDDEYTSMLCVEPGILSNATLEPGKTAELSQTIRF